MSQFFGCISLKKDQNVADIGLKMEASLKYVTDDKIGYYINDNTYICNKLIINSPESVNTPIICSNENYILAATVRLDNREELAEILNISLELSDHEYLLAAYTTFHENCVNYLIGDFSFVVWDIQKKNLFLAKDHLGIKPLFYLKNEDLFIFSTSITAIKAVFEKPLKINELYLAYELKGYQMPVELTFFEEINRLKPAHFVNFNIYDGVSIEKQYWELEIKDFNNFSTEYEQINELKRRFEEAIKCRTRSIKNIGCQLSGGLDSSAITVQASRIVNKNKLHTFAFVLNEKTIEFSEKRLDGQKPQNQIIEFAGLEKFNHHKIEEFHFKNVFEELEHKNLIMGGHANSDAVWESTMFKEAQKYNIGRMFSGFPGDECLSNNGLKYYYDFIYFKQWKKLVKFVVEGKLKAIFDIFMYFHTKYFGIYILKNNKKILARQLLIESSKYHKIIKNSFETFYPSFKEHLKNQVCRPHTCLRAESEGAYALQYGIETVYPFADIRLLEFIISLPIELFKPKPLPRMVFRKLCVDLLPTEINNQPKLGAYTIAFSEYWKTKKIKELKNYTLIDRLKLIRKSNKNIKSIMDLKGAEIDYLIEKNSI